MGSPSVSKRSFEMEPVKIEEPFVPGVGNGGHPRGSFLVRVSQVGAQAALPFFSSESRS